MLTLYGTSATDQQWLRELLAYIDAERHGSAPEIRLYKRFLSTRLEGCELGQFAFWPLERLHAENARTSRDAAPGHVMFADWLLDSHFYSVRETNGEVCILHGAGMPPLETGLHLREFVARVLADPTDPVCP